MQRVQTLFFLFLASFMTISCAASDDDGKKRVGVDELDDKRTQWAETRPNSYRLQYSRACAFCLATTAEIEIGGDEVLKSTYFRLGTTEELTDLIDLEVADTSISKVEDLFDAVNLFSGKDVIVVKYDSIYGYPTYIKYDDAEGDDGDGAFFDISVTSLDVQEINSEGPKID